MFDPFFSTKASGTGLGLPISRSIIREHGGRLTYEQNAAGGACFRIRLPVSPGTRLMDRPPIGQRPIR